MDENTTQRKLPIAVGNSSKAKFWKNQHFSWDELCDRLQTTIYTSETVKEYAEMSESVRKTR